MNTSDFLRAKIAEAVALKFAEQDKFCSTIKSLQAIKATSEHRLKILTLGWDGLLKYMANECFPPADEDWIRWLHIDRNETPFNSSLLQIPDPILRGSTQYLQGVTDQAKRQSAIAKFFGCAGGYSQNMVRVFTLWSQRSSVEMMLKQFKYAEMTLEHGAQILEVTLMAFDLLGDDAIQQLAEPTLA